MPGSRKTTMCENGGEEGNVRANWVGVMVVRLVRTGREGRIAPNIVGGRWWGWWRVVVV